MACWELLASDEALSLRDALRLGAEHVGEGREAGVRRLYRAMRVLASDEALSLRDALRLGAERVGEGREQE